MPVTSDQDLEKLLAQLTDDLLAAQSPWSIDLSKIESANAILDLPPELRPQIIRMILRELQKILAPTSAPVNILLCNRKLPADKYYGTARTIVTLLSQLLRSKLDLTESDIQLLLSVASLRIYAIESLSLPIVLRTVELYAKEHPLTDSLRAALEKILASIDGHLKRPLTPETKEIRGQRQRINALLHADTPDAIAAAPLETAEPWAALAQQNISALPAAQQRSFNTLLLHLQTAEGSKPSQKWLKQASSLLTAFSRDQFRSFLLNWLPLTPKYRTGLPYTPQQFIPDPNFLFSPTSESSLKGLAWIASLYNDPQLSAALGDLGESCWKKIPNHGPRNKLVGNAVLWSLSAIAAGSGGGDDKSDTTHAVAQITRINSKLKHASARALADRAMNRVAESTGQTRDDLEDLAIPTFNLDPSGKKSLTLGDFTLTLSITPSLEVDLLISDSAGKARKSIPAELKTDHAADIKLLQRQQKEIQSVLDAQRLRIESLLRFPDRIWSFENWKSRYLNHPLLSPLTQRLIWQISSGSETFTALPHNGKLLQSDGNPLLLKTQDSSLKTRLWHPSTSTPEEVRAWRTFLTTHAITQPFKQAHREIYLLTDAERHTNTYSNRFAGHIIRQHQFAALCAARGWKYKLQGAWDAHNVPTLDLPTFNMKAEFWVNQIEGPEALHTESYVSINLSTDQLRFCRTSAKKLSMRESMLQQIERNNQINAARAAGTPPPPIPDDEPPIPLDQIPAQLFSEILRDADLFVGVCSIANDPTWTDAGIGGRYGQYWQSVSFGDLNASAQTRKEILATLLPKLAIADVASLTDKFLTIKGTHRTYKIHLGSSNILMEPNDQYLCIVPDRASKSTSNNNLYLPFEGDSTLSLILSKALLLAHDAKITDPTILRQIRH